MDENTWPREPGPVPPWLEPTSRHSLAGTSTIAAGPRSSAADPRRWGCGDILAALGAMVGLSILFAIPVTSSPEGAASLWVEVFGSLAVWLSLGGWTLYASWVKGYGSLKLDFAWTFRWFDPFIGLGIGVATLMLATALGALQAAFGVEAASNAGFLLEARESSTIAYIAFTLIVAVGAPVVEELFFRGLTYSALLKRFGPATAVIGSTLLFGMMHFQPGPLGPTLFLVFDIAVFGLLLGLSRWYFDRTGPSVFAHMTFNLTVALIVLAGL
jgi:membrane protease YdiL (CAAX protease family)